MIAAVRIIALLAALAMATGTRIRRKRIVWEIEDVKHKNEEDGMPTKGRSRDLNVLQEGTIDDIGDEDWVATFFDVSSMSMSMPHPLTPSPPPLDEIYEPITQNILDGYCQEEYGSTSLAIPDQDGYDSYCKVTDDVLDEDALYLISIPDVCLKQFGPNHGEVLLGSSSNDWACVDWQEAKFIVVSVLVVASDFHSDSNAINNAIESVTSSMLRVQSWYKRKMESGKTFRLSHPTLQLSSKSAEDWNELSCLTASPSERPQECVDKSSEADRFAYYYEGQAEAMATSLPVWPTEQIVNIFIYTGRDSDPFWLGAAAAGPYSVNPPNVAVCPTDSDDCGLYAIGHEMGHSFGLAHSCEIVKEPKCYNGIMQNPGENILTAVLFRPEQEILDKSPYFVN